jgi:feruloyl esterase
MGHHRYLLGLMLAFSLVAFACVGEPARAGETPCDGSLTGKIAGNVVVPAGRSCTLFQADVEGNIHVLRDATLLVDGREEWSNIGGNVEAEDCSSALLEGSVTVGGNFSLTRCSRQSGFAGPGIQIRGNFECQHNQAACLATLGMVAGNVEIEHNRSATASDVSLNVIGGNLNCQSNVPAPVHTEGGGWVKGELQGECAANLGFESGPHSCTSLAALSLPDTTISLAQRYEKGAVITADPIHPGLVTAPVSLCRVVGNIQPSTNPSHDSNINFEVWLPIENWTGRYEQVGNGGLGGFIRYIFDIASMQMAVANNNATASTDDGTSQPAGAPLGSFASGHLQKINDFGYRAVHRSALNAEVIVAVFYGDPAAYRYFDGCSKGGEEGLMEAQRYPDDFDGILVGSAANSLNVAFDAQLWNAQQVDNPNRATGFIPNSSLQLISDAVLAACAGAKTVPTDNFLSNPLQCHFKTQLLSSSLTPQQIQALDAVYDGPRTTSGQTVAPGLEPGNEMQVWPGLVTQATLTTPPTTLNFSIGSAVLTYFLQKNAATVDPLRDFNVDTTPSAVDLFPIFPPSPGSIVQTIGSAFNATNPNLQSFRSHGGKIIQYHGWSDPSISPRNSINYFNEVVEHAEHKHRDHDDALADTQSYYRLFMAPGMGHCRGGPGLTSFGENGGAGPASSDMFTALEEWVEHGVAPARVIATNLQPTFTRPLCPYPQNAVYVGRGSTNDAGSFECR